jgi:hypothetical protein
MRLISNLLILNGIIPDNKRRVYVLPPTNILQGVQRTVLSNLYFVNYFYIQNILSGNKSFKNIRHTILIYFMDHVYIFPNDFIKLRLYSLFKEYTTSCHILYLTLKVDMIHKKKSILYLKSDNFLLLLYINISFFFSFFKINIHPSFRIL